MGEKYCTYDENEDKYDTPSLIPTKDRHIKLTKSTITDLYGKRHWLSILPKWTKQLIEQLWEDREYYKGFPLQIDAVDAISINFPNDVSTPINMCCGDRLMLCKPKELNEVILKVKWEGGEKYANKKGLLKKDNK